MSQFVESALVLCARTAVILPPLLPSLFFLCMCVSFCFFFVSIFRFSFFLPCRPHAQVFSCYRVAGGDNVWYRGTLLINHRDGTADVRQGGFASRALYMLCCLLVQGVSYHCRTVNVSVRLFDFFFSSNKSQVVSRMICRFSEAVLDFTLFSEAGPLVSILRFFFSFLLVFSFSFMKQQPAPDIE